MSWLLVFALPAAAYEVELKKDLNGMKVSADATGGPMAKVVINNGDKVSAHCRVEFITGRGAPAVRVSTIKPGKRAILTAQVAQDTSKLRVNAVCKPPKGKGDSPAS